MCIFIIILRSTGCDIKGLNIEVGAKTEVGMPMPMPMPETFREAHQEESEVREYRITSDQM